MHHCPDGQGEGVVLTFGDLRRVCAGHEVEGHDHLWFTVRTREDAPMQCCGVCTEVKSECSKLSTECPANGCLIRAHRAGPADMCQNGTQDVKKIDESKIPYPEAKFRNSVNTPQKTVSAKGLRPHGSELVLSQARMSSRVKKKHRKHASPARSVDH